MADVDENNNQEIVDYESSEDEELVGDFAPSKLSTELRRELSTYNQRLLREFTGIETLPLRPQKWTSTYNLFVRDFHQRKHQENPEMSSMEIIREAYPAWTDLPNDEKDNYRNESMEDKHRYNREIELWRRYKRELQPIPSAFALFTKYMLENNRQGRSRDEVKSCCRARWPVMTRREKEYFVSQRGLMSLRRWSFIDRLRRGANIEVLIQEAGPYNPRGFGSPELDSRYEDDFENPDSVDNPNSENNEHDSVDWAWDGPLDYLEDIESSEDENAFTETD